MRRLLSLLIANSYKLIARSGEGIFLFLFLLLLPFQTRLIVFSSHPFDEWQAGFLYGSDIAFFVLLVFVLIDFLPNIFRGRTSSYLNIAVFDKKIALTLTLFSLWAVASAAYNGFPNFSAYHLVKLGEGLILFFYFFFRFPRIFSWRLVAYALAVGAFAQSITAATQFALQRSLGLWFFRESPLTIGQQNVAQIVVHGVRMIRAYGTFPSPNVLAAFLAVSLFFLYALVREQTKNKLYPWALQALQFVFLLALFLTFSRAILVLFSLCSIIVFIALYRMAKGGQNSAALVWIWCAQMLGLAIALFPELTGRFVGVDIAQDAAINERLLFNVIALQGIQIHPFFGVGIGNFVSWFQATPPGLQRFLYQPVHNVLLLIAAEMGIPALLSYIGFLAFLIVRAARMILGRGIDSWYFFLCASFGFMFLVSMEDHFFWTIQQTTLLFWIVLGMVGGYGRRLPPLAAEGGGNPKSKFQISN